MGILHIISENKKTFYDYETGAHISQWPRAILFVAFGCVTAVFIHSELKDFLAGLLNVLAIVSGFSFTTLFAIITEKNNEKHSFYPQRLLIYNRQQPLKEKINF